MSSWWPHESLRFEPVFNRLRGRWKPRILIHLVRRRLPVFFLVLTAVAVAVLALSQSTPPRFRADAEVLLGGPSVAAELARLQSPAMARAVAARLSISGRAALGAGDGLVRRLDALSGRSRHPRGSPTATAVVLDRLRENVAISHTPETLSLTISYSAPDPTIAAQVANAYAAAYTDGPQQSSRGHAANERIIATATAPTTAASFDVMLTLLLGLGLGAFVGLGVALVTELIFPGLTTGTDVQDRLWVRHLGSVPTLASALPNARSVLDAVVDHSRSGFAEAFRNVIRRVRDGGANHVHVIAVASSVPNEGATTVAMALARTLALERQSVVIVDCDGRRRLSSMFAVDADAVGLADVLADPAKLDTALFQDAVSGAAVLPQTKYVSCQYDPSVRPRLPALGSQLRARYDVVLLTVGPIADTDVRWLQGLADTVLLIARWRFTPDTTLSAVIKRLRGGALNIAGVALNQVDMNRQVHYTDDEASIYQQQFSKYFH